MAKIEQTPSGPVAHVKPDESLDLTEELKGKDFDPERVGDTPRADEEPALVDTSDERTDLEGEGDKIKEGYVSEVEKPDDHTPSIGDLRKAGYVVPDKDELGKGVKDSDPPGNYAADTPTPPGEVHLVQQPETDPDADLSPNERDEKGRKAKAVTKAPKNK